MKGTNNKGDKIKSNIEDVDFTDKGFLIPGVHEMNLGIITSSVLIKGSSKCLYEVGGRESREFLLNRLERFINQLKEIGKTCPEVGILYLMGDFIRNIAIPVDNIAYFSCSKHMLMTGNLQKELNLLVGKEIFGWDSECKSLHWRPGGLVTKYKMFSEYGWELFPFYSEAMLPIEVRRYFTPTRKREEGYYNGVVKLLF